MIKLELTNSSVIIIHIDCTNIIKIYKTTESNLPVTALRGIDLQLNDGSLNAIMGPSGSGKTTLMRLVGGLDSPSAGTIKIGDYILNEMDYKQLEDYRKQEVGFVQQDPEANVISSISIKHNLEIPMRIKGIAKEVRDKKVTEIMDIIDLKKLINRSPKTLSGGQLQRLGIALAIISEPKLLLADEPTAELDSENTEKVIELFKSLNESLGTTIIISTHNDKIASKCDTYRLYQGRIASVNFNDSSDDNIENGQQYQTIDSSGGIIIPDSYSHYFNNKKLSKLVYNEEKNCFEIYPIKK